MLLRVALAAAVVSTAPMQCGHTSDAELREDESPGDALWRLAQRFKVAGDAGGERQTLAYLLERYPVSRWRPAARDRLRELGGGPDADAGGS